MHVGSGGCVKDETLSAELEKLKLVQDPSSSRTVWSAVVKCEVLEGLKCGCFQTTLPYF